MIDGQKDPLDKKVSEWDDIPDCELENPPEEDPDCPYPTY